MLNVGVLVSGEGSNLQAIIDACEKGGIHARVSVVVSNKQEAKALTRAKNNNIPCFFVDAKGFASKDDYEKELLRILRGHSVELLVLAGYMKIVGKILIDGYPQKIMNIHPALLPSFPGLHAGRQALEYGVKVTGVTIHFVDEGVDTGPVIIQEAVDICESDTEETLMERVHHLEHTLYPKAIQLFSEGRLKITGRKVNILESSSH